MELYILTFQSGKSYIGVAKDAATRYSQHLADARRGSEFPVHRAWRKHGAPKIRILLKGSANYVLALECKAIAAFGTLRPVGYNAAPGGRISPTTLPSVARKVSLSLKGRPRPQWVRDKIGRGNRGKKRTLEMRAVLSAAHLRPETRALLSRLNSGAGNPMFGKPQSAETRAKQSAASKGRPKSAAHAAAIGRAKRGVPLTAEHKSKLSEAHRRRRERSI